MTELDFLKLTPEEFAARQASRTEAELTELNSFLEKMDADFLTRINAIRKSELHSTEQIDLICGQLNHGVPQAESLTHFVSYLEMKLSSISRKLSKRSKKSRDFDVLSFNLNIYREWINIIKSHPDFPKSHQ